MMSVLEVLNEKPVKKYDENDHRKMDRIYHDMMLKLIKKFKEKADDQWKVLDPIIEYIWEEYDISKLHTLNELREFMRWAYSLLKYFQRTTITNLHSITTPQANLPI